MEVDKENEIKKERKERISRFEMHRLEKDIYPSGSKRSFEVSPLDPSFAVGTRFSKCGSQTRSIRITWELVKTQVMWPHARCPESEKLG